MDVVRGVYVDVARDMLPDDRARTDSRISLMTGVHRKELRRHRAEGSAVPAASTTIGGQVIGNWLGLPGLQDEQGRPLPLPRTAPGTAASFEALVAAVTTDVRPRVVLDEWLTQGLVQLDADGQIVLQAQAYVPRPGDAEQFYFFGRNLHDHIAAASANIEAAGPPFLERAVHYDGLSAVAAERLAQAGHEAAQRMLVDVNRMALAIAESDDRDPGVEARTSRVNIGAYIFQAQEK